MQWPREELGVGVSPAAMLWPRDQSQGVPARLGPGVGQPRVAALPLSSIPGSLRAQGLAAFPENTVHCLPVLSLSGGPALSHGRIRAACGPAGSPAWESLPVGWGPRPASPALAWKTGACGSWVPKLGPHPQKLGVPGLRVATSRAGGQSLENAEEALCFQGRRQGKGHPPSQMSKWLQNGPSPNCLCQGRAGVDGPESLMLPTSRSI